MVGEPGEDTEREAETDLVTTNTTNEPTNAARRWPPTGHEPMTKRRRDEVDDSPAVHEPTTNEPSWAAENSAAVPVEPQLGRKWGEDKRRGGEGRHSHRHRSDKADLGVQRRVEKPEWDLHDVTLRVHRTTIGVSHRTN